MTTSCIDKRRRDLSGLVAAVLVLAAVVAWSYWPVMRQLFREWQTDDDYSAGQLVPIVTVFLVWRDRKIFGGCALKPCWWAGIPILLFAACARIYGLLGLYESIERYSMVVAIVGLVLLVAGWQLFRKSLWILLFLFLMIPLPGQIHNIIGGPLRGLATSGSVFLLEAFGARVGQQGNVMMLNGNIPLAVAEACSGLRMLMAFIIVAAFIAYMVKRSRVQKAILLLSSVAVGVMCNIIRIFATAILVLLVSTEFAEKFFHDFAGLVMMPIAVLLMFAELWIMNKLTIPDPSEGKRNGVVTHA